MSSSLTGRATCFGPTNRTSNPAASAASVCRRSALTRCGLRPASGQRDWRQSGSARSRTSFDTARRFHCIRSAAICCSAAGRREFSIEFSAARRRSAPMNFNRQYGGGDDLMLAQQPQHLRSATLLHIKLNECVAVEVGPHQKRSSRSSLIASESGFPIDLSGRKREIFIGPLCREGLINPSVTMA